MGLNVENVSKNRIKTAKKILSEIARMETSAIFDKRRTRNRKKNTAN